METIKNYTSLEQSKVLNKILSDKSADIVYVPETDLKGNEYYYVNFRNDELIFEGCIYAWSLAALLNVLKDKITFGGNSPEGWFCCFTIKNPTKLLTIYGDSIVDVCYEMILKLHELKML